MKFEEDLDRSRYAARMLAEEIMNSLTFFEYEEAKEALSHDETANKIINELKQLRTRATYDSAAARVVPEMEKKAKDNPVLNRYYLAEEKMALLCQDVGGSINKMMQFDFGAACSSGCGCC